MTDEPMKPDHPVPTAWSGIRKGDVLAVPFDDGHVLLYAWTGATGATGSWLVLNSREAVFHKENMTVTIKPRIVSL